MGTVASPTGCAASAWAGGYNPAAHSPPMHNPDPRRLPCRGNGPPCTAKALETIRPQVDRGEPLRQVGVKTVRSRILVGVRPVRGRYGGSAGSVARLPPPPVRARQVPWICSRRIPSVRALAASHAQGSRLLTLNREKGTTVLYRFCTPNQRV